MCPHTSIYVSSYYYKCVLTQRVSGLQGAKMSNLGFLKRKPLWKNAPTRPVACLSELTKEMYGEIEVYKTKTRRANERKEREAVEGNKKDIVDGGRIPLAKTVDEVSLKTKTLTDVLSCIDADYGTSLAHTFSTTHRPKTHKSPDTSGTGGVTGANPLSPRESTLPVGTKISNFRY